MWEKHVFFQFFWKICEKILRKILPIRGKGVILHSLSGTTGHDSEGNGSGKVIEILANKTKVVRRKRFETRWQRQCREEVSVKSLSLTRDRSYWKVDAIKRSDLERRGSDKRCCVEREWRASCRGASRGAAYSKQEKKEKRQDTTTKSLILAQDER